MENTLQQQITPAQAMEQIEQALNAAVQRGVFQNMQSAAFIFECLNVVKYGLNATDNNVG